MASNQPKKVLICVLNWGLGHATRCIPIIKELQNQGINVSLASDGRALQLLQEEFKDIETFDLPAYNVTYRTANMFLNLAPQMPRIFLAIRKERKIIDRLLMKHQFDFLISDNRFGCFSNRVPSVFITHQVNIKIPFRPFERIVNFINYRYIRQFTECWIPDKAGTPNLSGTLAHGIKGLKVKYLGVLSRMQNMSISKKYDLAAVLSGPEPQRSFLEKKIIKQAVNSGLKTIIIQGKPELKGKKQLSENVESIAFLTSKDLNKVFAASSLILSRSGYTTVLDLAVTGRSAILIPTPGQTEQEYLADNLKQQGIFFSQKQKDFNLEQALKETHKYRGFGKQFIGQTQLKNVLSEFLTTHLPHFKELESLK